MLKHLYIKDFAIIDRLDLDLSSGMTVLTGETGAGKSIIIGALNLVLGGRAQTEVIRTGSDSAEVTATFSLADAELRARILPRLQEQDIPADDDEVLVRRIVSRTGRNKIYVNGTQVTAAVLEQLATGLVDITGQHEHVWLLHPETQLDLLDAFAGLSALRADVAQAWEKARSLDDELRRLRQDEKDTLAREDFLRFQVRELRDLSPAAGEETKLLAERKRLSSTEKLRSAVGSAEEALYAGESAVVEVLGKVKDSLRPLVDTDDAVAAMLRSVEEAQAIVEDVSRAMGRFGSKLQADPERLEGIEERLEKFRRLTRKHGCTADALVEKAGEHEKELDAIAHRDEQAREIEKDLVEQKRRLAQLASTLSDKRKKAAQKLAEATLEELAPLGMERAQLVVAVDALPARADAADVVVDAEEGQRRISCRGMDRVEFRFSANAGEEALPLRKVASGGELSRVLLGLKRVLAQKDPVPVYVFDEVDAGVGGAVGEAIGIKIRGVSAHRQALCVTHLAQIAAHAENHFVVEKVVEGGRTVSRLRKLGSTERVEEIARMLGGIKISDATRRHARDLLKGARGVAA